MSGKKALEKEIFYLAYHLHWSHAEVIGLPIGDRKRFIRLLSEEIERQNREWEESFKFFQNL